MPQNKKEGKINVNLIAQAIDTLIASFFSNGLKVKFISRQWWIWAEEAENLNAVASFDKQEIGQQQLEYQCEQDSLFFGVGITNRIWWDSDKLLNKRKTINPLSRRPDPLATQTWQFDSQNFRFHGFMMRTTVYDMKSKYNNSILDNYFKSQQDSEEQLTRDAYARKNGYWPITCDTLEKNFSTDIYNHYTIVDGKKRLFVTDPKFSTIFERTYLEPVTREEKLNPLLVPWPIMLNYYNPQRDNPLGGSICDAIEDKQNWISILMNLNLIKSKKESLGGDFLVNSRLIKNKDAFTKKTTDSRYFFIDEEAIGTQPIQNAMFELPQSQIKSDTFAMMDRLTNEANKDTKVDSMQSGLVPDKALTATEVQQIQANANNMLSLKNAIKSRYYQEFYFQRWRGYLENLTEGKKKFALLSSDFEYKWVELTKDQFVTKQMPYILIWTTDDIMAITEKQRQYVNLLYPQIIVDQSTPEVSKNIFKRLAHRINGLQSNVINWIVPYSPSERKAIEYIGMINMWYEPKTIFDNSKLDLFTLWLYLQKAEDGTIKDKILKVLDKALIDLWLDGQTAQIQDNSMANSASNQMMAQSINQQQPVLSRTWGSEVLPTNPIQ